MFWPSFYLQCLKNNRESTLKVFVLFRAFFLSFLYQKARNFCNVFDTQTLLLSRYFWFYNKIYFWKCTFAIFYIITQKNNFCNIYGRFCLPGEENYYVLTKKHTSLDFVQKPFSISIVHDFLVRMINEQGLISR